jgi:SAM-dependent methyltransferase
VLKLELPVSALSHYSLAASDEEHRRLIALAMAEEDRVRDACVRVGIGAGHHVVDLGCGPLGALHALASVVGPEGRVVGIDASAAALDRARSLLQHEQSVRLVHADVNAPAIKELPIADADLVFSRLFLLHQHDPSHTIRNAATLLRSGGAFIAHEPSDELSAAPASEPPVPAMTRVWDLVIRAAHARGARTDFGLRGRAYLERAGLTVESHRAYMVHYPSALGVDIPRIALHSLWPTLEEHALASRDEIEQLNSELEAASRRTDVQWVSSPLMFEWIARKP